MRKIEIHPAFKWTCDACWEEQYGDLIRPSYGGDEDGEWLMAPETVTCKACGETYETEESEAENA